MSKIIKKRIFGGWFLYFNKHPYNHYSFGVGYACTKLGPKQVIFINFFKYTLQVRREVKK